MIDIRSISFRDILPGWLFDEEDLAAICDALDPEIQDISTAIEEAILYPRIMSLPEDVLDEMSQAFPNMEVEGWSEATLTRKRELMVDAYKLLALSGTVWAVDRCLELLDIDGHSIREWFDTGLTPYRYSVLIYLTTTTLTLDMVRQIREMLRVYAPVRSYLEDLQGITYTYGTLYYGAATSVLVTVTTGI